MNHRNICLCVSLLFVCMSGCNRQSHVASAIGELRQAHKDVSWDAKTAVVADVTCDGKPDTVILGYGHKTVSVGVVASGNERPLILSFPIARDKQDGFCVIPTSVEVTPLDCESDQGALQGCEPDKSCHAFTVVDTECDPFNFYWNSEQKALNWWRL